jgi:hypothetical protein
MMVRISNAISDLDHQESTFVIGRSEHSHGWQCIVADPDSTSVPFPNVLNRLSRFGKPDTSHWNSNADLPHEYPGFAEKTRLKSIKSESA